MQCQHFLAGFFVAGIFSGVCNCYFVDFPGFDAVVFVIVSGRFFKTVSAVEDYYREIALECPAYALAKYSGTCPA